MAARRAWVLNLDADVELAALGGVAAGSGGGGYTPSRSAIEAMRTFVPVLAASLVGPEDMLVDESTPPLAARGLSGFAFCPTPRAIAILRRAGAEPSPHPRVDVLRRVNSRAFAASLGMTMPQAAFVEDLDVARKMFGVAPDVGEVWRVKRAFGMAGRGQRLVTPGRVTEPDLAFVGAGLAEGGVQIEPNVVIVNEYAIHGMLADDGSLELGALVEQRCDARGAWIATERLSEEAAGTEAARELASTLGDEASRVAAALASAKYFGPFGIDAYTYRDREGTVHLQPRSEINARYTMGYAVGKPSP
jgi:hypothetical protein